MKMSEIKVGEEYVWSDTIRAKYSKHRVKVVETNVTEQVPTKGSSLYSYTRTAKGLRVEWMQGPRKGRVFFTEARWIHRTWAEEQRQQRASQEAKKANEERKQQQNAERAQQAFALHQALVTKGVEVGSSWCYDDGRFDALVAAGFEPDPDYPRNHLLSAVPNLSDLMDKGRVDLGVVTTLMGLTDPDSVEVD